MMKNIFPPFFVLLAMAASAWAAAPMSDNALALGNDLSGEACTLRGTEIICGASKIVAGSVRSAPATWPETASARRQAILAAAGGVAGSGLTARDTMRCDEGRAADADTIVFACTLSGTSWPHMIVARAEPGAVFVAEGLPGLLPVMEAAIAARTGMALVPARTAAVLAVVKASFPERALGVGADDRAGYMRFIAEAGRAGSVGDFAAAEAACRSALDIASRAFGPDSAAAGSALMELALQVSNQQRFDEAAALFRRATPIVESVPSPAVRARLASYRGLDAANQRDYATALRYARDNVTARQSEVDAARASTPDINGNVVGVPLALEGELAHALRIQAEMSMRLDDMPSAQAAAERALYIVTQHPELPLSWRPDMVSLMGEINTRQGRVVAAERNFLSALGMYRKLFAEGSPAITAQLRLGRFYAEEQMYAPALAAYREAFADMARQQGTRPHQVILDQVMPFFAAAAAGTDDRARLDREIFAASQLFDSGVAGQTIARIAARRAAGNPALALALRNADEAERRRQELRIALATEQARPSGERDAIREKAVAVSLASAVSESGALNARLRTDFPGYAQLATPGPVTLAALQKSLRPREGFVSFAIGVRAGYVLLVTADSVTVRPLAVNSDGLAADIAALRRAFVPVLGKMPEFSLANAAALYRDLLGPVSAQLAGVDHLVVAASGGLSNLPFALLTTGQSAPGDYVHAPWLVRRMAVSQIPSARAFVALRAHPAPAAPRPFLGLGNPAISGSQGGQALAALASACQQGDSADPALLRSLPPLPETSNEVRAIAARFKAAPGDVLLGADASERNLRARPLDQYAVLYFATHGMLPGELHCQAQPGLVLTPPSAPIGAANDGLLTASEISELQLNASLVVLSACNTAAAGGSRFGGGALEGLAEAFFSAGAHGVLASHWEVPSQATASLMTGLFANMAPGGSSGPGHGAAEALRQAQLMMIAQRATASPYQWAAFTLIGDGG